MEEIVHETVQKTAHELVLTNLLTVRFKERIIEANEADDPNNYFIEPGFNFTMQLIQPVIVGRAAAVCKAWYTQVQAHRTTLLMQVVIDYVHFCMLDSALHLVNIDMYGVYPGGMQQTFVPPETRMRMSVRLGSCEMYAVEAVRCTIEPVGDGIPIKLILQTWMRKFTDAPNAPPKTYMKREIAVHRVCWIHKDLRKPKEQKELDALYDALYDAWHDVAYERLRLILDLWKNVFVCKLHVNIFEQHMI